jgi:hypothetical protein
MITKVVRDVYILRDISRSVIGEAICKGELTYLNCLSRVTGGVEERNSGTKGAWSNRLTKLEIQGHLSTDSKDAGRSV